MRFFFCVYNLAHKICGNKKWLFYWYVDTTILLPLLQLFTSAHIQPLERMLIHFISIYLKIKTRIPKKSNETSKKTIIYTNSEWWTFFLFIYLHNMYCETESRKRWKIVIALMEEKKPTNKYPIFSFFFSSTLLLFCCTKRCWRCFLNKEKNNKKNTEWKEDVIYCSTFLPSMVCRLSCQNWIFFCSLE